MVATKKKAIKIFLFDLDDTLIDSTIYAEIYSPILEMIKKKLNFNDEELSKKVKSLGLQKNKFGRWDTGDLCRELGLLKDYYLILEKNIKTKQVLRNEVIRLFKTIKSKKTQKIGIVSNSMKRTIGLYLNRYQLNVFVDFVFSAEDAGCRKNHIEFWKELIEKEKLDPKECLVIGDDEVDDVLIPKRAGFNTFLIHSAKDLEDIDTYKNKKL